MATETLSRRAVLRAWASHQGFGMGGTLDAGAIVAKHSWVRTLGGADPYFALFARGASLDREVIDDQVLSGALRVTPAVRGCMYLVANEHADLALSLAFHDSHKRNQRDLEKAGGTAAQVGKTAKAILSALELQPSTTAELRKAIPVKAITRFGEQGKKVGLSSSLPVALRQLEFDGEIERAPVDGRLDTETYRWSLRETPMTRTPVAEALRAVGALFFAHHSPASVEHFTAWAGVGKTAARAALADLGLLPVAVETHSGEGVPMLATPAALDLAATKPTRSRQSITLLGLQDLYLVVHGGPAWACPEPHLGLEIPRWGPMRGGAIADTKHPHLRAVLLGDELAGFWEVNAAIDEQVITCLDKVTKATARAVEQRVTSLRRFMAEQLGHAKTYSIDSDASINARFELVRGL